MAETSHDPILKQPFPRRETTPLLRVTNKGLYCERGDFYIDPWEAVDLALLTHGHGDHARVGSSKYLAATRSLGLLFHRLGPETRIEGFDYGEKIQLGDALVSFHPAGHILGSAQIRIECDGEVWVVSGDYKRDEDPTCDPFEVVPCDVFITEATFALPIYRWESGAHVAKEILTWWEENAKAKRPSLLFCYALGKAQRVLAELSHFTDKPVYVHGAVESLTRVYRDHGIRMLPTLPVAETMKGRTFEGELILAPPSAYRSPWMKRFKGADTGFASGWMRVRGARRRRGYDRGFVLSDHADWDDLVRTVRETGAKRVLATHGYSDILARYLNGIGIRAEVLSTQFQGEQED